jgi:hypothetical protein
MRRLRRLQEEEPPPGTVPRLNFRQRRLIRALLADPSQDWSFNAIWYTFLLMPFTVLELGEELATANLAQIRWLNGKRCLALTEFGIAEFPGILELYRTQRPLAVLMRRGPRAAAVLWYLRHRDRTLRRARKREQLPPGESHDDERPLWM